MSDEIVVYYYADPAFRGDLGPVLDGLKRRGHRVVKGDNTDELLFLLQVGRPVAVIYTLASAESATTTAYQMVSRRVLDLLVPLILVGPEDPRDGVSLLYPEGRAVTRHHVPLHSLSALIERFAAASPGTPSRPPEVLLEKTLGRGRTVLSWQAAAADVRHAAPPDTSEIAGVEPGSILPSKPAPLPPMSPPDTKTIRMLAPGVPAPGAPPPSQPPTPAQVPSGKRTLIAGSMPPPRPEEVPEAAPPPRPDEKPGTAPAPRPERAPGSEPASAARRTREAPPAGKDGRRSTLALAVVFGLLAVLGAAGIAIWLATRPAAPPPSPIVEIATAPAVAKRQPSPRPAPAPVPAAVEEEPGGEVERPAELGPATTARPRPAAPAAGYDPGVTEPFPAHFRGDTALFWFDDDVARDAFLARIRTVGASRSIRLTGHATESETAAGRGSLGLSRAWAVRKWLVRQGVGEDRILTARGRVVTDHGPRDPRGLPLNNWVEVTIE